MATQRKAVSKKTSATKPRHRTLATEQAYIPNYPQKLFIYKLEASSYWWVRYYVGGKTVRKSTKETGKQKAIAFAKDFYDTVTHNYRVGIIGSKSATNFEACTKEMLKAEKAKLDRGELTKITYNNTKYRYDKHILPYFRTFEIGTIDYYALEKFLAALSKQQLSSSTVSAYMRLVGKVLAYAARRRLIQAVPEFPKLKVEDKARGWFSVEEYSKLVKAAYRYAGTTVEVRKYKDNNDVTRTQYIKTTARGVHNGELMRKVVMTYDLRQLIVFMVNSYIRPTDIKFMQHKHVDIVKDEYVYLRLRIPPTKNHSDPITTMPNAVKTYAKLKERHLQINGNVGDDDYVFLPQYKTNRDYALKQLQRQFEIILWDTKLSKGVNGEQHSLYSLRHTCIMYRLLYGEGINTLALARNARTSVEMIDRFYAKPLTGEMNVGMLQSRRRKRGENKLPTND